ncbi:MAG: hypothetical protein PHI35_08790, partial [Victivallaceae bacterium]|nr:hypothetical protein [Victivallaceae bacterium]
SAADAMINTAAVIKDLVDFIVRNRQTIVSLGFTAAGLKVISMASGLIQGLAASYKAMAAASAAAKLAAAEAATATTAAGSAAAVTTVKVGLLSKSLSALGPIAMTAFAGWEIGKILGELLEVERALTNIHLQFMGVTDAGTAGAKPTRDDYIKQFNQGTGTKAVERRAEYGFNADSFADAMLARDAARAIAAEEQKRAAETKKRVAEEKRAAEEQKRAQEAKAALIKDKLSDITAAEKKAAEERRKIALQRDAIDFEIKRDAMGAQIDAWKKKITDYGKQIDAVDKKLSRFGASVDEDILKTPEQIAQDKKDDLLRVKITAANKGEKVSFTAEERDRINSLREEQLKARKLKAESSDLSKQSETSEASISAEARDRAAADKARRLKELDAREKITNAVSATASTASSDMQLKDLITIISRIDLTLKHGLPSETK